MRHIVILLLLSYSLVAGQGLVWSNTSRAITGANVSDSSDIRLEFRVRNYQLSASTVAIAQLNFFDLQITNYSNRIEISTGRSDGNNTCQFMTAELSSDMVIRVQIVVSPRYIHCEKWDTSGGGYVYKFKTPSSWSSYGSANGTLGGLASSPGALDFIRGFTSTVPVGSRPPVTADVGDYFDWKLDGNGNNTAGAGPTVNTSGSTFESTPALPPTAIPQTPETRTWADYIPLRAGFANTLNGTRSYSMADASSGVTCRWAQVDHAPRERTSLVRWANRNTCEPTVSGLVFGPYKFRLSVVDADGLSSTADLAAGAVAYGPNGVVVYPDPRMDRLIGPQTVLGQDAWEWLESQQLAMARANWAKYEIFGGPWYPEWLQSAVLGVPRTGTAYTLSGAPTKLYGVGTNFLIFCGGAPGAVVGTREVSIEGAPGQWYTRTVASCQSDTEITTNTWESFTNLGSPGVRWGTYGFDSNRGEWRGQRAANVNYYDVALGHYRWYLKSGDYRALQAFRWLADSWARNAYMTAGLVPRDRPMIGIMARQLFDGGIGGLSESEAWAVLRRMRNTSTPVISTDPMDDPREASYALMSWAVTAKFDPDETSRNAAKDILVQGYAQRWQPQQQPSGNYIDSGEYGDRDGRVVIVAKGSATVTKHSGTDFPSNYCGVSVSSPGTVAVGEDRVTLTGSGTSFSGSNNRRVYLRGTLDGQPWSMVSRLTVSSDTAATLWYPWRGDPGSISDYQIVSGPVTNSEGAGSYYNTFYWRTNSAGTEASPREIDSEWYWCRRVNGTTITLDKPYTGDTSGGNIYRRRTILNTAGRGTLPWHMGITSIALSMAADALDGYDDETAAGYRSLRGNVNSWIRSTGYLPATKGMRYAVQFANCKVPEIAPAHDCWEGPANGDRSLLPETFGGLALEAQDGNEEIPAVLDDWYTAAFAVSGYASPTAGDGNYAELIAAGVWNTDILLTKSYGQTFGVGDSPTWPAKRVGGPAPAVPRTVRIGVKTPFAHGADSVRVRVQQANGSTISATCEASPCEITGDFRAGSVLATLEYLDGERVLARSSEPLEIK